MAELRLESPLQYVKGVGPRKGALLASHGLKTVRDLLNYFPRQYLDRTTVTAIRDLRIDHSTTIIGEVRAHGLLYGRRKRYEVILDDGTAAVTLVFFAGIRYWERMFKKKQTFAATGTVGYFNGYQMVHPELERLDDDSDKLVHSGRIIPVYPQTAELTKMGLNSRGIRKLTTFIFEHLRERIADPLPESVLAEYQLINLHEAVCQSHYPDKHETIETSRRRHAFDEMLELQFVVRQSRGYKKQIVKKHSYKPPGKKVKAFYKTIPFELTAAQKRVSRELFDDMASKSPMTRLMQGDVGCGKTVVAALATAYAAENNLQVAFMAPTEILVEQHFRNWAERFESIGLTAELLTATLSAKKRREISERCSSGEIDVLFGTHALVYDSVSFERLGLVIIDEQHRFGVEQRGRLYAKGDDPDLLVMTATPIPRTLALTVYGDLDLTTIDEIPPGRLPVRTVWRTADSRPKIYQFIRDEVEKGGQVYCVYPLIDKSEQMELESVEEAYKKLKDTAFKGLAVEMVHGRTKPVERDLILEGFRKGEIKILMATTVIEVGLDNPNATIMLIEHAERFGLAQLHQLRGRVGRGERKSTVIAVAHPPLSDKARERLQAFADMADGFDIAEADLRLRGPGEMFGLRQSGVPMLRAANLAIDSDLLESSRELLEKIFDEKEKIDSKYKSLYTYLNNQTEQRKVSLGGG